MRRYIVNWLIMPMLLLVTACSADGEQEITNLAGGEICLTSSVATTRSATELQTNAVSTDVVVGAFGVAGTTAVTNGANNQYAVQASGALKAKGKEMKWPKNTTNKVDIYAYAPYNKDWTYNAANSFSVSTDQSTDAGYLKSDLLHASAKQLAQTKTAIPLTFTHKLARLCITLNRATNAIYDLSKSTVYITNTKTATTLNPSTGELGAASGDAKSIQAATDINIGTATKVYAVVVPQKLANGTKLVRVKTTDGKYLTAKIGSDINLEGGKTYNFTASLAGVELTELTLGSVTLTGWGAPNDLGSVSAKEVFSVGDYVLADGTFLKTTDENFDSKKANIVAVIFSTTSHDAGYDAYAVSIAGKLNTNNLAWATSNGLVGTAVNTPADALSDYIGLARRKAFSSDFSTHPAFECSGAPAVTGANLSAWFIPSVGQMVDIIQNLGEQSDIRTTITSVDAGSSQNIAIATDVATFLPKINAYAVAVKGSGNTIIYGNGNGVDDGNCFGYVTSTEKDASYMWMIKFPAQDATNQRIYLSRQCGKTGTSNRNVLPCIAVKFPTE